MKYDRNTIEMDYILPINLYGAKIFFMKFKELGTGMVNKDSTLTEEYKNAHSYGVTSVGDGQLFVKEGLSIYYIPYENAERIFRRIRRVNAQMCCDNGELEFEYLVIMAGGKEVIEVQLPGKKAAKMLMEELKGKRPEVNFRAP